MQTDKHIYIIIGLLVVIIGLIVGLYIEQTKTVRDLLRKATENIASCSDNIKEWRSKYSDQTTNESAKAELDSILQGCAGEIEAAGKKI